MEEIDHHEGLSYNSRYLRARVWLHMNDPLLSGFFLKLRSDHIIWVKYSYKNVFKICHKCGVIGHFFNNYSINNQRELHRFLAPWVQGISQGLGYEFWVDDQEELFPPTLWAHQHHTAPPTVP